MKPRDLCDTFKITDVRLSPRAALIAFTCVGMDVEKNEYTSRIYVAPAGESSQARAFTTGERKESLARFSPDGKTLAFAGKSGEKSFAIFTISLDGGEASQVVDVKEAIEALEWSPDGKSLAFASRDRDETLHGADKPTDLKAKRITHLIYRLDNVGWTVGRPRQIFIVDAKGGVARKLTSANNDIGGFTFSPDSSKIVFSAALHDAWDLDFHTDLFEVSIKGGKPRRLTPNDASYSSPSFSASGTLLAFEFSPDPQNGPHHTRIGILDMKTNQTRILTEELDRNSAPSTGGRSPVWSGDTIHFLAEDSGNVPLFSVDASGTSKAETVIDGDWVITSFDVVGKTVVLARTSPTLLNEILILRPKSQISVQGLPAQPKGLVKPERFLAQSKDGSEVEAWIMKPVGFKAGRRYPALLNIHGGPFTQYGNRFFDEFQVQAAAGYVVIYSNPRGSAGYSEAWGRAIKGPKTRDRGKGWGSVDFEDIMGVVDHAIENYNFIDEKRVGVLGGSYGGYMTSWIIGHTDRFKAAISERAVNNLFTLSYTSDIGSYFREEFGPLYIDDPKEYMRMSPITYAAKMKTPVMILHSENDLRCPISQAEELFSALRLRGHDVEFVRFPGSSHELSRSGSPRQRIERFEIILDWFKRKL